MNNSGRRILITGGLGFIGTKVIDRLDPDDEILVVDNLHPQVHENRSALETVPGNVRVIVGDVTDADAMRQAAQFKPTIVLHLAAETGTGQSLRQSRRHANVNVTGTATLLDALAAEDWAPSRFVLTSSRAVYGEGKWVDSESGEEFYARPRTGDELDARNWAPMGPNLERGSVAVANETRSVDPRPANVYAATKLAQEHIADAWCTSFGVPLTILRLQNVFGAGQALGNPYTGVLTFMARQANDGQQINVYEDGGIIRDFVNVSDVADAIVAAMAFEQGDLRADIGSGTPVTLSEVAVLLAELAGAEAPATSSQYRLGDVRAAFADISVAQKELRFNPEKSLAEGLAELLTWVRGNK